MKDAYDHGHDDGPPEGLDSVSIAMARHGRTAKDFIDPGKMAERKEITDARVEGYIRGKKWGYRKGIAHGIGAMVLLIALVHSISAVASPAMAQNPDTGDAALALDIRAGTTGDVFEDSQREFKFLFAVLMPITDRLTVTAKMERRRLDLRQYQDDGLWKFESESTFWEVGCKIYIGSSDKTR